MERWSADESRALIALRERVERETSRSINAKAGNASDDDEDGDAVNFGGKRMWEWVSTEMKKQGYHRSMVQCKAKWTVLFNRYKSMELSERQGKACPFFDELTVIFKIRAEQAARVAALGHGVVDTRPAGLAGAGPAGSARAASGGGSFFGSDGRPRVDSRGDAEKESLRRKLGEGWLGMKVDKKRLDKMWEVQGALLKQHALLEGQWGDEGERVEERGKESGAAWIERLEQQEKRRLAEDVKWREEEERRAQKAEAREVECDAMLQVLLAQLQAQTYPTFV
ncbi:unnamed protein product [Closterium sp. Yama58-4]|nr:unnamed protein product [Closterium sp. Yama58-4]